MKSFLFCTSYVNDHHEGHHSLRYLKWLKHYEGLSQEINVDYIFLIDDGSPDLKSLENESITIISADTPLPEVLTTKVNIISFRNHLGRSNELDYPGWWRSFTFSYAIAQQYNFDKIVHIESDFYILNNKLCSYIDKVDHGWLALYSKFYKFPETGIQIITKSNYENFKVICEKVSALQYNVNYAAELYFDFTTVCADFVGDRLGEIRVLDFWKNEFDHEFDYIGHLPVGIKILTSKDLKKMLKHFSSNIDHEPQGPERLITQYLEKNDLLIRGKMVYDF